MVLFSLQVLLSTLLLLAISTHAEVNNRLLRVLARSLDITWRSSQVLKYINGAKVLTWLSRYR